MNANRPRRREGFALMAALWLVVIVGVTGYELTIRSRTRRLAVANTLEYTQGAAAAEAALETARAGLENRLLHPLDARTKALSTKDLDPWSDLAFLRADTIVLGDERASSQVFDAGTRVQINRASEAEIRRLLTALPLDAGLADRLAQRIMDWRDADDFRRASGAERDEYLRNGARRLPTNADFGRVEDLLDVDGMTREIYTKLAPLVTALGTGQINVNAAPAIVLHSLPGLGDEAIALITRAQVDGRPIRSLEELTQKLSPGARQSIVDAGYELPQHITFETREVVVESEGWVSGSPVRVHAESLFARGGDALFTVWRRIGT
ncbi:MAG: general secretion pathway protein GspK [Gemmatimonadota bacterium]|nr:general secretion pathway protein GspK [Gemmatimonadota bacterium]